MKSLSPTLFLFSLLLLAQKGVSQSNELYLTKLKTAEAYLRLNQIGDAKKLLASIPNEQRAWEWQLLHAQMDRSISTLQEHTASVVGIALSKDGKVLATGSADKSIIIWDAKSYAVIRKLLGHNGQVTTLDFSPEGRLLVSGSTDKTLRLWEVATGNEIKNFNAEYSQGIYQSKFSPDGKSIAAGSWEMSPGNKLPVVGFAKVLDVSDGKVIRRFDTDDHPESALAFSPDGKKLYTGTWGFHIKQHGIANGTTDWDFDLNQYDYYTAVQSVDVSSDGKFVVQGGKDTRIRLLDAMTGKLMYQIDPWQGHREWVNAVRFSPDGKFFASGSDDGLVKVWESATGKTAFVFRGHVAGINQIAWHPDGKRIFSTSADNSVKVWNIGQPGEFTFRICEGGPWSAPISPDGKLIASAGSDKAFTLWNLQTANQAKLLDGSAANAAAFSSDGKVVAMGGHGKTVSAYEVATGKKLFDAGGHSGSIYGIAYAKSQNAFASAGDKTIRLWNVKDGSLKRTIETVSSSRNVAFTPDEQQMIVGCRDGNVRFYETKDWLLLDSLQCGTTVLNMSISNDGKYLTTGGDKGDAFVVDIRARKILHRLRGHAKWVYGTAFHPSKPYIVTASYDRTVRIWDAENGTNLLTLFGFENELYTVSVVENGKRFVITQTNGMVHVINL